MTATRLSKRNLISVTFLIGGTCIGGGMLALPVSTSYVGFFPSLVVMLITWVFMTVTGLLILEVNLWMKKKDAHVITMASEMLGRPGKVIAWIIYLFVCYASLVAYTSAGGSLTASLLNSVFDWDLDKMWGAVIFIVAFSLVIYMGNHFVGKVNTILFTAMLVAYGFLIAMGADEVKLFLLSRSNWDLKWAVLSVPLLLTSFSYQYIIPSLTPMLNRNVKFLRIAIIGGTSIALVIYLLWQWLILGTVPLEGERGLAWAYENGEVATGSYELCSPKHGTVHDSQFLCFLCPYYVLFRDGNGAL